MEDKSHLHSLDELLLEASWVSIGSFDGIHRGHQKIIKQLVKDAGSLSIPTVVVTFFPHPAVVLRGIKKSFYLTSPEDRASILTAMGIDYVITLPFTKQLAALSAFDFMQNLKRQLGIKQLWVGNDFTLGKDREGNIDALMKIGGTLGYKMKVFSTVSMDDEKISSSQIRALLHASDVKQVAHLLGRPYAISSQVIPGDQRGRKLGFPTANLEFNKQRLLPAPGVYITWASFAGQRYPSVTNIGTRPTFEKSSPLQRVETHVLDFDKNIYGATITLEFVDFIRPEQRFASIEALINQIHQDSHKASEVLQHAT